MVYVTGNASNSHHLASIIHAAMRDAGWSLVSGMNSDGTDSVFYSDGVDGYQDIYIRVAAKLADRQTHGDIQFPSSDGYTGYVNCFAYQYFPEGGSSSSGTGEVGRYGPLLHIFDSTGMQFEEYNFFKAPTEEARGRGLREATSYTMSGAFNLTDGHRYVYSGLTNYGYLMRYDLGVYPDIGYTTINTDQFNSTTYRSTAACFSRKNSTEPLLWNLTNGTYATWSTYNTITGESIIYTEGINHYAPPPWGASTCFQNWVLQGLRRTGKKHIYTNRGYGTSSWARYDIDENEWTWMPGLPFTVNGGTALLVAKEATGYEYDRLYINRVSTYKSFSSIAIDDDGDPIGSWSSHAETLIAQGEGDRILYLGGNKLFYIKSGTSDFDSWTFPISPGGSGSWTNETYPFHHNMTGDEFLSMWVRDHLASRVDVDEFKSTQYWIFVDKDRLAVVTNSEQSVSRNKQEFMYAGLFDSDRAGNNVQLTSPATVGQTTLAVSNVSDFKVGSTYKMVGLGNGSTITVASGESVRVGAAEKLVIQEVKQSTSEIIVTPGISGNYAAGSKIGEDVQPVGVSLDSLDRMHTVNVSYALNDDISKDRPYQYYYFQYPQRSYATSSGRDGNVFMWPIMLRHDAIYDADDNAKMTDSDIRGSLVGVYFSSGSDGDTIEHNGKNYMIFSVDSSKLGTIAIGPME